MPRSGAAPLAATEPVDLAQIVMEVSSGLHWHESDKHLRTEVTGPASLVGNAESLRQLVIILLDNAFKYAPPDGEVQVLVARRAGRVILTVMDNGPGIPPQEIDHVFETFYRASNVRNLASGSGLGLSIARSIVANHGGEIALTNVSPKGLMVSVSFQEGPQCHDNLLPIPGGIAFAFHSAYGMHIGLKRWKVWGPIPRAILVTYGLAITAGVIAFAVSRGSGNSIQVPQSIDLG